MDSLILPRWLILEKAVNVLNFNPPCYTEEPCDDGLFRCQIRLTTSDNPDEETTDTICKIWSGWFPSIEEARENAAYRTLNKLEDISVFHIEDYSMTVAKNLRLRNHQLSSQCSDIAKAIERLLQAWSAMTSDINKTKLQCLSSLTENEVQDTDVENKFLLESILHQISKLSKKISDLYDRNMEDFRRFYQPISDLLKKHLVFNPGTPTIDPGEIMSIPVIIPATDMLAQILHLLQANPPEYTYMERDDGNVVVCCAFCKDKPYLPDIEIEKVCSRPLPTIESAQQAAALNALQHLDSCYQLQLHDYNYSTKEDLIDENRSLLTAKKSMTSALVDIYNTIYRDSLFKLSSIIQTTHTMITRASEYPARSEEFSNVINSIMQSLDNIYDQLLETHDNTMKVIKNHEGIKNITSKMYSYIV